MALPSRLIDVPPGVLPHGLAAMFAPASSAAESVRTANVVGLASSSTLPPFIQQPSRLQLAPLENVRPIPNLDDAASPRPTFDCEGNLDQLDGTGSSGMDAEYQYRASLGSVASAATRYSVHRSTRNSTDMPHVFRLTAGYTDGQERMWPAASASADSYGYRRVAVADARHLDYKLKLGESMAKLFREYDVAQKKEHWILADLPAGYAVYVDATVGQTAALTRESSYLFGSHCFRSPDEFMPHLYWLIDSSHPRPSCLCKYCDGVGSRYERDTNEVIGLKDGQQKSRHHGSGIDYSAEVSLDCGILKEELTSETSARVDGRSGPQSSVHASGSTLSSIPLNVPPTTSTLDIYLTASKPLMRPVDACDGTERRKRKRKGGAFIESDRPHHRLSSYDGSYPDRLRDPDLRDGALFRQGEMVWIELPRPIYDADDRTRHLTHWPGIVTARSTKRTGVLLRPLSSGHPPNLQTTQHFEYHVSLLACSDDLKRAEHQIKPWLAFPPPNDIAGIVIDAPESVGHVWNDEKCRLAKLENLTDVIQAATAFALALQIAAHIVGSFSLSDRYKLHTRHLSSRSDLTDEEVRERSRSLGFDHFQSLWWGSERIWTGELVRLIADSNFLAMHGHVFSTGSERRAVFLKVSSFYKDDLQAKVMASGIMYELQEVSKNGTDQSMRGIVDRTDRDIVGDDGDSSEGARSSSTLFDFDYMPLPPLGYHFRRITSRSAVEAHCEIEYIAGRFYPLADDLTSSSLRNASHSQTMSGNDQQCGGSMQDFSLDDEPLGEDKRRMVLAGLLPACMLFMRCNTYHNTRVDSIVAAVTTAQEEMETYLSRSSPQAS